MMLLLLLLLDQQQARGVRSHHDRRCRSHGQVTAVRKIGKHCEKNKKLENMG